MRTAGLQKSTRPTPNTSQYTKKRTIKQQQNARPGGDTEDKTFGKPFPNGRCSLNNQLIKHSQKRLRLVKYRFLERSANQKKNKRNKER